MLFRNKRNLITMCMSANDSIRIQNIINDNIRASSLYLEDSSLYIDNDNVWCAYKTEFKIEYIVMLLENELKDNRIVTVGNTIIIYPTKEA